MSNGHGVVEFPLLNLIEYHIHSLLAVPFLFRWLRCYRESLGRKGEREKEELGIAESWLLHVLIDKLDH